MIALKPKRARSHANIADDIVRALDGGKKAPLKLPESETRAKVLLAIEKSTEFFARWDDAHSRKGRTDEAESAGKIAGLAAALASELKAAPELLSGYLFGPKRARHEVLSKHELDFLIGESLARKSIFLEQLTRLRDACERLKEPPPESDGPEQDRLKNHCATVALNLMKTFSDLKPVGSVESPFPVIASLLFEAATGEEGANLKKACDRVLAARRAERIRKREQEEEGHKILYGVPPPKVRVRRVRTRTRGK